MYFDTLEYTNNNEEPRSCPIRVDNKFEMFGCDVGEVCCNPLDDPVPEFRFSVPDKNVVCSSAGSCTALVFAARSIQEYVSSEMELEQI